MDTLTRAPAGLQLSSLTLFIHPSSISSTEVRFAQPSAMLSSGSSLSSGHDEFQGQVELPV